MADVKNLTVNLRADISDFDAKMRAAQARLSKGVIAQDASRVSADQLAAGLKRAQQSQERFAQSTANATKRLNLSLPAMRGTAKASRVAGGEISNVGYQLNDIGVMLAAGQSPFVLAMQQGTQLSQVMNRLAAKGMTAGQALASAFKEVLNPLSLITIGMIAAIGLIVKWGRAWYEASKETDEAKLSVEELGEAIDALNDKLKDWEDSRRAASMGLTDDQLFAADAWERANEQLAEAEDNLRRLTEMARAAQMTGGIGLFLGSREDELEKAQATADAARELVRRLSEQREIREDILGSAEGLAAAEAANLERWAAARGTIDTTANDYVDILGSAEGLAAASAANLEIWAESRGTIDDTANLYVDILGSAEGLAAAEAANLEMFRLQNEELAAQAALMQQRGKEIMRNVGSNPDFLDPRGEGRGAGDPDYVGVSYPGTNIPRGGYNGPTGSDSAGGSGGGGGGANSLERELESIRNFLATEEELQVEAYASQQEILTQALEQRLLTRQEYNELMEEAERHHTDRMSQIDAYRHGDALQQTGQFMGDLAAATASGNEKMVEISRKFGAVEALINAYRAFNQTLADPSLPWFAKIAAATSILASGLSAVNSIKGAGGGGGTGGGGPSPQTASEPATRPTEISRNVAIQLTGGDTFSRSQVRQLINEINQAVEGGAIVRLV